MVSKKTHEFLVYKSKGAKEIFTKNKYEAENYVSCFSTNLKDSVDCLNLRISSAGTKKQTLFADKMKNWIKFNQRNEDLKKERLQILEEKVERELGYYQKYFWIFFIKTITVLKALKRRYDLESPIIK